MIHLLMCNSRPKNYSDNLTALQIRAEGIFTASLLPDTIEPAYEWTATGKLYAVWGEDRLWTGLEIAEVQPT